MKKRIIVTHKAPDLDAVSSSWIIKRFLPGWENAEIMTVSAGQKLQGKYIKQGEAIETVDLGDQEAEVIHVDTGMGKLDHHQENDDSVSAAKRAYEYVLPHEENNGLSSKKHKKEALRRIVEYVVDDDHFQEVFYENPTSDAYDMTVVGLIHGLKLLYPKEDMTVINFGMDFLDAALHTLESKIHAEEELKDKGIQFKTKWGKSIAVESANDAILKLAQIQGYVLSVRKDPVTGSVRIKARPPRRSGRAFPDGVFETVDVDLTEAYEKLQKMDTDATWYLHVGKRMLLNGSSKNPSMLGTKLSLAEVVGVLQNL